MRYRRGLLMDSLVHRLAQKAAVEPQPLAWKDASGKMYTRASALGDCKRAVWYSFTLAPSNPSSIDVQWAITEGQLFEDWVIDQLQRLAWDLRDRGREYEKDYLTDTPTPITIKGHIDAMLYALDQPYAVFDAKRQRLLTTKDFLKRHDLQMQAYMDMSGVDLAIIGAGLKHTRYESYKSAEGFATKHLREFTIKARPDDFVAAVRETAAVLYSQECPERLPPTGKASGLPYLIRNPLCQYCRFVDCCMPHGKMIKINNIPKLVTEESLEPERN